MSPLARQHGIGVKPQGFAAARAEVLRLARKYCYAAMATSTSAGVPQVAPLRYTITDDFEVVMGTLRTSRKYVNLTANDRVALVIWDYELSIQIEGRFDIPTGADEERLRAQFTAELPREAELRTGRPNHLYFRVTPHWARVSDFSDEPPRVLTIDFLEETETRGTFPVIATD
ncbi:MAG: pyridoxamine 5'-phosphate oxidase family protein [Actinomycetota bacterium]